MRRSDEDCVAAATTVIDDREQDRVDGEHLAQVGERPLRVALRSRFGAPREVCKQLEIGLGVVTRELGVGAGVDTLRDEFRGAAARRLEIAGPRFEEAVTDGALRGPAANRSPRPCWCLVPRGSAGCAN